MNTSTTITRTGLVAGIVSVCCLGSVSAAERPGVMLHEVDGLQQGLIPAGTPYTLPNKGLEGLRNPSVFHLGSGDDPEADGPRDMQFSCDGQYLLIAHEGTSNVTVLDAETRAVVRTIAVSGHAFDIAVSSDNTHAVVANIWDDTASVIDYIAGVEVAILDVGDEPFSSAFSPDGSYAVVGNRLDQTYSVIDMSTLAVERTVTGGGYWDIAWAFSINGGWIYTWDPVILPDNRLALPDSYTSPDEGYLNFVDLTDGTTQTLVVGKMARFAALSADGARLAVIHNPVPEPFQVTVVDTATTSIERVITTSQSMYSSPPWMAMRPDGSRLAFFSGPTGTVIVNLEDETDPPIFTFQYGSGLATDSTGDYLFINRGPCSALIDWVTGQPLSFNGPPEFCVPDGTVIIGSDIVASSPTDARIAMLMTNNYEAVALYNVDGLNAHLEGIAETGEPVEGDYCRNGAVSADGAVAIGLNQYSSNATVWDLTTQSIRGFVDIERDSRGVAISPDGSLALVTCENLDLVYAVDLTTLARTDIPLSHNALGPVVIDAAGAFGYLISYDGSTAYLNKIDLSTSQLVGAPLATAPAGMQEWRYFQYAQDMQRGWASPFDLPISHDGTTMAVPGADGTVSLIDLGTWAEVARLTLGDGSNAATRAIFSPDDAYVYAMTWDINGAHPCELFVIQNAGSSSVVVDQAAVGQDGSDLAVSPGGDMLYVACQEDIKGIVALDLNSMTSTTIATPDLEGNGFNGVYGVELTADGSALYGMGCDGYLHTIDTATNAIVDSTETGATSGYNFVLNEATQRAIVVAATPYQDGITWKYIGSSCPEDLDGDGYVGQADLGILLAAYNNGDGGDIDGDGDTDQADLGALLSLYGQFCP
jgi:YVTN family beta-propeller protein